jgi:hypothetical protein
VARGGEGARYLYSTWCFGVNGCTFRVCGLVWCGLGGIRKHHGALPVMCPPPSSSLVSLMGRQEEKQQRAATASVCPFPLQEASKQASKWSMLLLCSFDDVALFFRFALCFS